MTLLLPVATLQKKKCSQQVWSWVRSPLDTLQEAMKGHGSAVLWGQDADRFGSR